MKYKFALAHLLAHRVEAGTLPQINMHDVRRPAPMPLDILKIIACLVKPRRTRNPKRVSPNVFTRKLQHNRREPLVSLHLQAAQDTPVRHREHRHYVRSLEVRRLQRVPFAKRENRAPRVASNTNIPLAALVVLVRF